MSGLEITYLVISIVFLVISFIVTSAEIAYINLPRLRVEHLVRTKVPHAETVAALKKEMERLLSTITLIASISDTTFAALGSGLFVAALGRAIGNPAGIAIMAFLMFVIARLTPRFVGVHHAERLALFYARPLWLITRLLWRVVTVASWVPIKLARSFGKVPIGATLLSREELGSIISVGQEEGVVAEDEARMLHQAVKFGQRQVREVMVPRTEATWIEKEAKLADFLAKYAEAPALRYPVYEETYDKIIGFIAVRDVVMAKAQGTITPDYALEQLCRPVYRVPGDKRIGELFTEMKAAGHQMAAVVSEYGGTSGIVNIEQLVEEIVGELEELATAEAEFEFISERSFLIDGSMRIEDANEQLGLEIPEGDYQMVSGFALSLFGHFPAEGEQVTYEDLTFLVKEVAENRIRKLIVSWEEEEEETLLEKAPPVKATPLEIEGIAQPEEETPLELGKKAQPAEATPLELEKKAQPKKRTRRKKRAAIEEKAPPDR